MTRLAFALTLGLGLVLSACGAAEPPAKDTNAKPGEARKDVIVLTPAEQAAGHIETALVAQTSAPATARVSGRIVRADDRTWRVGVRTVGVVASVAAALGSYAKKGDVLARYHADEARELRAQYRHALADEQNATAAAALAQRTAERYQTLLGLKAASVQQTEEAQQQLTAAQAHLREAQVEVGRARDALQRDLKVVVPDAADGPTDADDSVPIVAPASGYILEKNITPGKTVDLSTDAFVIGDLSTVWMLAAVRQEQLGELHTGARVVVTVPGLPDVSFPGTVTNLGQELDPQTRTMPVRITLPNPKLQLKPEMLAAVDLPAGPVTTRVVISSDAVQQINGQDAVFVKEGTDRFVVRPVHVGATSAGQTPVIEGLKAGEAVVVNGSFVLKSHLLRSSIEGE